MGHVLSKRGISPTQEKVKAVHGECKGARKRNGGTQLPEAGQLMRPIHTRSCNNSRTPDQGIQLGQGTEKSI